ncbi:hypothetical protein C7M84_021142 [Penaeus vannamei]|uniref:Uncharacterized protein n=1 Tax=Penaeus vannamei TaxID=6689 RepID=A0A3R7QZT0_PENVA|nr:hypothetical protein C7M84_021142 [Penaeus vannamei]
MRNQLNQRPTEPFHIDLCLLWSEAVTCSKGGGTERGKQSLVLGDQFEDPPTPHPPTYSQESKKSIYSRTRPVPPPIGRSPHPPPHPNIQPGKQKSSIFTPRDLFPPRKIPTPLLKRNSITEENEEIMRTFSLALLVLLVAAVTMTNGTPIKKSQVSVFGSRQKRETNTDMPGSTDEDDGIDFDEPKDDGIVIMIEQVVGGPRCCRTNS